VQFKIICCFSFYDALFYNSSNDGDSRMAVIQPVPSKFVIHVILRMPCYTKLETPVLICDLTRSDVLLLSMAVREQRR
jgi:hypothetical protein